LAGESVKSEQSYFLEGETIFLVDSLYFLAECSDFLAGDQLHGIPHFPHSSVDLEGKSEFKKME
jgi:hypothetical protein